MTINRQKQAILRVYRQDDLYIYRLKSQAALSISKKNKSSKFTELLHRRMGHLNHQTLRLLPHISTGLTLGGKTEQKSSAHAKNIGELTHADILCRHIVCLTFVD
jgi:hypothetical protein